MVVSGHGLVPPSDSKQQLHLQLVITARAELSRELMKEKGAHSTSLIGSRDILPALPIFGSMMQCHTKYILVVAVFFVLCDLHSIQRLLECWMIEGAPILLQPITLQGQNAFTTCVFLIITCVNMIFFFSFYKRYFCFRAHSYRCVCHSAALSLSRLY